MRLLRLLQLSAVASTAALAASVTVVQAGDYGCKGQCYEKVPAPAYYRTFKRRITQERGAYEISHEPALYGWATRKVLVDDGIEWHEEPAIYKTVKVKRRLKSRIVWEKQWRNGRYVMCKVRKPGHTVWVNKQVLVKPARRWKTRSAPTYKYVKKRILLRPYKNIATYHKARHKYVRERVKIQPESWVWRPVSDDGFKEW